MSVLIKKELTEQLRSGKLFILGMLFTLFGIMNPAIAKLTPWLLEMMSESLAASGMTVSSVSVGAADSWMQFFKNIPIVLAAYVLFESSIFTSEYRSGTLVLLLTKGISRYKVVAAKTIVLSAVWSAGYWLCFGITYGYNAYFWTDSSLNSILFAASCWWIFGLWVSVLTVFFSTIAGTNTGVLAGTGIAILLSYALSLFPDISGYLPTMLTSGYSLMAGQSEAGEYVVALVITLGMCASGIAGSVPIFAKRQF